MNKLLLTGCLLLGTASLFGDWTSGRDLTSDLPDMLAVTSGFELRPDLAQCKQGDWSGCIGIARGISRDKALEIANNNPEITFFFYTKGFQMILETDTDYRQFRIGDVAFFTGEPQLGTAPGLADAYVRINQQN